MGANHGALRYHVMAEPILVGIDIGTTNLKVIASQPGGRVEAVVRRTMVVSHPATGASEFDLDALDHDLVSALREMVEALGAKGIEPAAVAGIGVASIGESFVGIDRDGRRLTPCPTWYDRRTANKRSGWGMNASDWFDITGMVDDDIYTVHRPRWWREAAPEWFAGVATWLLVADYVTALLCGQEDASR